MGSIERQLAVVLYTYVAAAGPRAARDGLARGICGGVVEGALLACEADQTVGPVVASERVERVSKRVWGPSTCGARGRPSIGVGGSFTDEWGTTNECA